MSSSAPSLRVALIGGSGFVGQALAHELSDRGDQVLIYDLTTPPHTVLAESCYSFVKGDVTDLDALVDTFESFKPDVVIHLASWGMSGAPMLSSRCTQINIGGVEAVLEAMRQTETECLVYTSTYNVVYGGEPIENGDEKMPYFDLSAHTDKYSASKAVAEQLVLAANGRDNLRTLALRPAAIYGDGEERHFPRIVRHIDSGLFAFRIGAGSQVDWLHVDNLVQCFLCAVDELANEVNPRVAPCGQAYFVNDGGAIDNFEFFRPLIEARGRDFPTFVLPVWLALALASVFEGLHAAFGVEPFLTRAEVYKVGVTHNFAIDKARRELGYQPIVSSAEGATMMGMAHSLKSWGGRRAPSVRGPSYFFRLAPLAVWLLVAAGMVSLYWIAFFHADGFASFATLAAPLPALLQRLHSFGLLVFRSQANLKLLFQAAVGLHLLEAAYAWQLAAELGVAPALRVLWFVQTAALGFGSLRYLRQRLSVVHAD